MRRVCASLLWTHYSGSRFTGCLVLRVHRRTSVCVSRYDLKPCILIWLYI